MMFRPLLFVIAVASSACAMAGLTNDNNNNLDGSQSPPADGNDNNQGSGSGSQGSGSGSGSGSNMQAGTCSHPFSGTLATWDLTGQTGSENSAASTMTATGATAGDVSRSGDLQSLTGADSINSSGFTTSGSLSTNSGYYTFKITPPSGCTVSLSGASIDTKTSSQGPAKVAVATSADQFGQIVQLTATDVNTPTLSVDNASGAVEVRVFGYDAQSLSGTLRIENTLSLTGSFQ
ncbi:MAG TPA: hypothetical protein VGG74_32280 [Kofleriaceae bacterium]|jgi:hypothetical protein